MSDGDDVRGERIGIYFPLILMCFFASPDAWAQTVPHIHLRGSSHIDVHGAREPGMLVLSGTVQDDSARPLSRARVTATFAPASDPSARLRLAASDVEACDALDVALETDRTGLALVTTNDLGRFCIRVALATGRYIAHLETVGAKLLDGSAIDLPVDLSLALVTLSFDPQPTVLPLDDESVLIDVIALVDGTGNGSFGGLTVSLSDERGSALGNAATDTTDRARFEVATERLGLPGKGELRASFAGNAAAGPATRTVSVERRTHVDLVAPDARGGRMPVGSPEDGIPLLLVARPRCARRACQASPTGIVEVRAASAAIVGAAPIQRGEAHVDVQFAMDMEALATPNSDETPLWVRYIPNVPWFLPGGELVVVQPLRPRSVWSRAAAAAPLLLAGTAVIVLLAVGRVPIRPWTRRPYPTRSADVGADVQLVRSAPSSAGWTGQVTDAHDGRAIAHARLAIERPGFERTSILAETASDAAGLFGLPSVEVRPGDELVAGASVHAGLRRPLPPSGEIVVALVLRKRALLDRLVAWTRRRGAPYESLPDATPGHVRRSAGVDTDVERWAGAIERAAYGGEVIDESAQAEIDRLAPPDDR